MRKFISSEPTLIFHLFLIIFGKIFGWIFSPKNAPKAAFSLGKNALDWFLTDSTNFTRFLGVFGGEKRLFQSFYTFFFSLGEKNVAKSESRAPIAVWYSGVFEKSVVTRPRATNHRAPFRCGNFYQAREKNATANQGATFEWALPVGETERQEERTTPQRKQFTLSLTIEPLFAWKHEIAKKGLF